MNPALQTLLQGNPLIWQGREATTVRRGLPTGFAELDGSLPGGGWPSGVVVELESPTRGVGELRILLPLMRRLSKESWIVWIAPPHIPYAPALSQQGVNLRRLLVLGPRLSERELLWSMERVLRSAACGMTLAWPGGLRPQAVRRLQLAAQAGGSLAFLLRPTHAPPSPAALRLRLTPRGSGLRVDILKARGAHRRTGIQLSPSHLDFRPPDPPSTGT